MLLKPYKSLAPSFVPLTVVYNLSQHRATWPLADAERSRSMKKRTDLPPSQKQANRKRKGKRKGMCMEDRPLLEQNAVGIDIGAREIFW